MRLWSLHPKYLDKAGLGGAWREGLLALSVLKKLEMENPPARIGYRNHSQLVRFKAETAPILYVNQFLHHICDEADSRGYSYNRSKLSKRFDEFSCIAVTFGQLKYEQEFLAQKLDKRDPKRAEILRDAQPLEVHPSFIGIPGDIESWEVIK